MIGAMALLALSAISFTARAADPVKLESIDVQTCRVNRCSSNCT